MNPLNEVVDYLAEKIESVNVDNPKANSGAKHLKKNDKLNNLHEVVAIAFDIIQQSFTKATSDNPAGECRLTAISSLIGTHIMVKDEERNLYENWELAIRIGDLLIEAYYNCGFVDLYYPQMRNSHHIVLATNKWTEIEPIDTTFLRYNLRGTVMEKPDHISGPMQMQAEEEKPIIKGNKQPFELDRKW